MLGGHDVSQPRILDGHNQCLCTNFSKYIRWARAPLPPLFLWACTERSQKWLTAKEKKRPQLAVNSHLSQQFSAAAAALPPCHNKPDVHSSTTTSHLRRTTVAVLCLAGFTLYVYTLLTAHYYVRLTAKKNRSLGGFAVCPRLRFPMLNTADDDIGVDQLSSTIIFWQRSLLY